VSKKGRTRDRQHPPPPGPDLDALVRHVDTAIGVVGADGSVGMLTDAIERITGFPPAAYAGVFFADNVHPDDLGALAGSMAWLLEQDEGATVSNRARLRHVDRGWRWVDMVSTRLLEVPSIAGVLTSVRDVHDDHLRRAALEESERQVRVDLEELRRKEQALLALLDGSNDAVAVIGEGARIAWVSPGVEATSGWSWAELQAMDPADLVHPDDLGTVNRALAEAVAVERSVTPLGRTGVGTTVVRLRDPTGAYKWVAVNARDMRHVSGVDGVVLGLRDVDQRTRERLATEASERRFRSLVQHGSDVVFTFGDDLVVTTMSDSIEEVVGYTVEQCVGRRAFDAGPPGNRAAMLELLERLRGRPGQTERIRLRSPDAAGDHRWYEIRITNLRDRPEVGEWVCVFWDVTAQVVAEEENQRLLDIFDHTEDVVILVDRDGRLMYVNAAGRRFHGMSGQDVDRALGQVWPVTVDFGGDAPAWFDPAFSVWSGEVHTGRFRDRPGDPPTPVSLQVLAHRDAAGEIEYFSAVARDMSERKQLEDSLARQATHDPLTGLPNRMLLFERITNAVEGLRAAGSRHLVGLLFIDIDHFKVINDSLGHALGDRLLQGIGERIRAAVRPGDVVGRFGGDEFVVLCERLDRPDDAVTIAHRIDITLQMPFVIDGQEIHTGVSIGIAFVDPVEPDPQAVLRDADTAMYRAKSDGRGRWVIFDDELRHQAVERQRIETALRQTRHGEELELHYQPVVDLSDGRVVGVEALVRWRRDGRLVPPAEFVPVAEETGLIVPIGDWVLREACMQVARWQELEGWGELQLAVNVSARQLQHPGFVTAVAAIMHDAGLRPGTLSIELTESVVLEDVAQSRERLDELRGLGVSVAVDDFGTGYSSLTYLHQLPIDVVKLDRSFVAGVGSGRPDTAIVTAVVDLASALGLTSVAEGIENELQLRALRALGCTQGQGYLLARPAPADEVRALLDRPGVRLPRIPVGPEDQ
jgi:diguanylate cyclase (GGDEF)-like protein/PAS domain S-box-containing protein